MSDKVEIGNIIEGKVVHIKPFGAIVSLGTVQGFVHISQVANGFVDDINQHLKLNDIVKVKVTSIDSENNKISLSIRDALPKTERPQSNQKQSQNKPRQQNFSQKSDSHFGNSNKPSDFEDKMKDWLKQSTERQTTLNKRANKRSY